MSAMLNFNKKSINNHIYQIDKRISFIEKGV